MVTRIFYPASDWWVLVEGIGDNYRYALVNPATKQEEYSRNVFSDYEEALYAGLAKRADLREGS